MAGGYIMYKVTLFFINGIDEIYPTVEKYLETSAEVERFCARSLRQGGVWIYNTSTEASQITHNRNILYAEVIKIDPSEVQETPYIVEAVK